MNGPNARKRIDKKFLREAPNSRLDGGLFDFWIFRVNLGNDCNLKHELDQREEFVKAQKKSVQSVPSNHNNEQNQTFID